MRWNESPFLLSVTVGPVDCSADLMRSGERPGFAWRSSAAAAAAWGDACDVPRNVEAPPPRPAAVIGAPGASRSTLLLLFEKQGTWSARVVASVQPKEMVPASLS